MKVPELIRDYSTAIDTLIKNGKAYWAFGLICAGIEFLGKCLDDKLPFNSDDVKGSVSFKLAIDTLMPTYSKINDEKHIYGHLRNGILHSLIPKENIWLRELNNLGTTDKHLDVRQIEGFERVILVIEIFYDDFIKARDEVIKMIEQGKLTHEKVTKDVLAVIEL